MVCRVGNMRCIGTNLGLKNSPPDPVIFLGNACARAVTGDLHDGVVWLHCVCVCMCVCVDVSWAPGDVACLDVNVVNSTNVKCTALSTVVGRFPVTVVLNNVSSSDSADVGINRMCGADKFAVPGQRCAPCPKVRDNDHAVHRSATQRSAVHSAV